MSKPVLFASIRPLERAENINAIYTAYPGDKVHMMSTHQAFQQEVMSGKYDIMVTDDFPSVTPGKCIVIWHAIQGLKKVGLDQPGKPYYTRDVAERISYIISASKHTVKLWSKCTGVPMDRILPLGMPRTDEYFLNNYEPHDKKVYLFVPTFRDKNDPPFPHIDWAYIDSQLTDNEVFVIKAHPWQVYQHMTEQVTPGITNGMYKHIVIVSPASASAPFLYNADVVITDYSSIIFDAYLLNIPVVLFEKEPGYIAARGTYFNFPEEYCSFFAQSEHKLIDMIRYRAKHPYLTPAEKTCINVVADACDGHSCERICKLINQMKGDD